MKIEIDTQTISTLVNRIHDLEHTNRGLVQQIRNRECEISNLKDALKRAEQCEVNHFRGVEDCVGKPPLWQGPKVHSKIALPHPDSPWHGNTRPINYVPAIKALREATGWGLADAKNFVDKLCETPDSWSTLILTRAAEDHLLEAGFKVTAFGSDNPADRLRSNHG